LRFLAPAAFVALSLALPILLLYMLRLRRRDVTVPSVLLWQSVWADRHANRPWQRLRRNLWLLLHLLILLVLVLALARPALPAPLGFHGQVIVLLDVSASMQAQEGGMTRLARAARGVRDLAATLAPGDRVALIAVGPLPRLLLRDGDAAALRRALEDVTPSDGTANWSAAAALASGLASDSDVATLLVTDAAVPGALPALPGTVRLITVGQEVANVGVVAFALRRAGEGMMAFARVRNVGPATARAVSLYADGVLIHRREVPLSAEDDVTLTFADVPVRAWAEVRLEPLGAQGQDALAVDDHAWVALTAEAGGHALLVSPGNRFLAQALRSLPALSLEQAETLAPVEGEPSTAYGALVVDGPVTGTLPTTNLWLLAPGPDTACGAPGAVITPTGGVRGRWSHPLLQYVTWDEVHVARARHYTLPADAEVLLETASGPLLWTMTRPGQRIACLAFDLHDSDLPLRLAFPILTANLMGWLLPQVSAEPITPLAAGRPWTPDLPPTASEAVVVAPDGSRVSVNPSGGMVPLVDAGLYRVEAETPAGTLTRYAALSLVDPAESDLRPRTVQVGGEVVPPTSEAAQGWRDMGRWVALVALVLLLLEAVLWWGPEVRRIYAARRAASLTRRVEATRRVGWTRLASFLAQRAGLRLLLLFLLLLAFLGFRWPRRTRDLAVVFLLDRSASTQEAWEAQVAFVEAALAEKSPRDRAALVVFGGDAWVDRPLSVAPTLHRIATLPRADATDIEEAVRLGVALVPQGLPGRLVLLTDGLQTTGRAAWALQEARARDLDVQVVQTGAGTPGSEVWIADLRAPAHVYPGDRVPLAVEVGSNAAQSLSLTWTAGARAGQVALDVSAQGATQVVAFDADTPGFVPLQVCLAPEVDTFLQNNCADGWVLVEGAPRVLVVGEPEARAPLVQAIRQSGLAVATALPAEVPLTVHGLGDYAALALVNTPARDFPPQSLEAIRRFVQDLGGGLVAVGGPTSYGVGGWLGTPLETALPVEMRVQDPERFPPLMMIIVIDKSGSMAAQESGVPKIRLAAEAAIRVAETLNDTDVLGVVAFGAQPGDTLGPASMTQRDALIAPLRRLQAGGGGIYVHDSLAYARELLRQSEAGPGLQRHILLLADGADAEQQDQVLPMVAEMLDEGVTVSAVAIGQGSDVAFLREVAGAGGGRFYLTEQAADLPAIFSEEAAQAKRSYIVEETFYPVPVSPWAPVAEIDQVPPLYGYVATSSKPAAQVVWQARGPDPLLATWQYGLGRAVAWTSDASGRWASAWVTWDAFARFWGGILRHVLPPPSDAGLALEVEPTDAGARVVVDAVATDDAAADVYANDLSLSVQVAQPQADTAPQIVELAQTAPGRYAGEIALPPGSMVLRLYGDRNLVAGWAPPPPAEYVPGDAAAAVARLAMSVEGSVVSSPGAVFVHDRVGRARGRALTSLLLTMAVVLWPLDIAWRRLVLAWRDVGRGVQRAWGWVAQRLGQVRPPAPAREPGPSTLASALRRQQQRRQQAETPGRAAEAPDSPPPVAMPARPERAEPVASRPTGKGQDATGSLAARLRQQLRRKEEQEEQD
jgi:uncharacterized membrane protein